MDRSPLALSAAVLGACLLAGCTDVDPWMEVGSGVGEFSALEDGDVLEVERGTQGGQHVWIGLRADGIVPGSADPSDAAVLADRPLIELALDAADGRYSLDNARHLALSPDEGGTFSACDLLLQVRHYAELPPDWERIDWRRLERELEEVDFTLRARVVDTDGVELTDEREVRLRFPPAPGDGGPEAG